MTTTTVTKKRVLFFIPEFPVLTETFIEREVAEFSARGNFDVGVFSLKGNLKEVSPELREKVYYHRLSIWGVIPALGYFLFNIHKLKYLWRLVTEEKRSVLHKLFLIVKSYGYSLIVKKLQPDLILAHFLSEPSTLMMLVSEITGIPLAISAHAKDVLVTSEYSKAKICKAKFILVCNKNAYQHLLDIGSEQDSSRVIMHYHGIDLKRLSALQPGVVLAEDRPLIISIGRLTEKKGHEYLIRASKILRNEGVKHKVYIIGPGPLYKTLQKEIEDLGVEENVKILGEGKGLTFANTIKYLKLADLLVFSGIKTDQGDEDGIPNVLLEAFALKIPVISTDSGSTTDVVRNEETGYLIQQKNPEDIAKSIKYVLENKDKVAEVVKNAYKEVTMHFDLEKNVVELEEIIKKAL